MILSDLYPYDYIRNMTEAVRKKSGASTVIQGSFYEKIGSLISQGVKNIILTGAAGGGKTRRMEGLGELIKSEDCPEALKDYRVFCLDLETLNGRSIPGIGAKKEEKLIKVLMELLSYGKVILFVDEIHKIVDMANSRLPLGRVLNNIKFDNIVIVGATTKKEYKEKIEKNPIFLDKEGKSKYVEVAIDSYTDRDLSAIAQRRHPGLSPEVADYSVEAMHSQFPNDSLPSGMLTLLEDVFVFTQKEHRFITKQDGNDAINRIKRDDFPVLRDVNESKVREIFTVFVEGMVAYFNDPIRRISYYAREYPKGMRKIIKARLLKNLRI